VSFSEKDIPSQPPIQKPILSQIKKGSRIRLNADGLKWQTYAQRNIKDWSKAVGIVNRIYRDRLRLTVIWDGNKSASDPIPVKFLCLEE
jgi:hypothetical protein